MDRKDDRTLLEELRELEAEELSDDVTPPEGLPVTVPMPGARDASRRAAANDRGPLAQVAHAAILIAGVVVFLIGCAELAPLLAPVAGAVGAYEAQVRAAAAAQGLPASDPKVLAAIEAARKADAAAAKLAEQRAAESRARDEDERRRIEALAAAVHALAKPCPASLPLVDAGPEGGRP